MKNKSIISILFFSCFVSPAVFADTFYCPEVTICEGNELATCKTDSASENWTISHGPTHVEPGKYRFSVASFEDAGPLNCVYTNDDSVLAATPNQPAYPHIVFDSTNWRMERYFFNDKTHYYFFCKADSASCPLSTDPISVPVK
jgi:hypothetical protein